MKKLHILLILVLSAVAATAQVQNNHGYSFGVRIVNSTQMPKLLNQTHSQDYLTTYFDKVFVKFNDNQISYRVSGNYNSDNITFKNQCETCEEANGQRTDYGFRVGFEKNLNYAILQPYFGFDLGYRSNNFDGTVKSIQPGSSAVPYTINSSKAGFTISPLLGLKFNVTKQFTIYAEGNMDFYYSYERRETVNQTPGSPTTLNRFTRGEYILNPIAAGVQVNF